MARPRGRRIASEDSDSGNSKDVGKKTKQKKASTTRKRKESTFVVSIPKTRVKLPSAEARAPRKLIIHNTSSSSSSPLPSSTSSYVNRPSFPSGHLSFKNKDYQVSCAVHFRELGHWWLQMAPNEQHVPTYVRAYVCSSIVFIHSEVHFPDWQCNYNQWQHISVALLRFYSIIYLTLLV